MTAGESNPPPESAPLPPKGTETETMELSEMEQRKESENDVAFVLKRKRRDDDADYDDGKDGTDSSDDDSSMDIDDGSSASENEQREEKRQKSTTGWKTLFPQMDPGHGRGRGRRCGGPAKSAPPTGRRQKVMSRKDRETKVSVSTLHFECMETHLVFRYLLLI